MSLFLANTITGSICERLNLLVCKVSAVFVSGVSWLSTGSWVTVFSPSSAATPQTQYTRWDSVLLICQVGLSLP